MPVGGGLGAVVRQGPGGQGDGFWTVVAAGPPGRSSIELPKQFLHVGIVLDDIIGYELNWGISGGTRGSETCCARANPRSGRRQGIPRMGETANEFQDRI